MEVFPSFDLSGRVALVTGAARGLGRAISLALAAAGADIALGLREVNADGGVSAEIQALGRRVLSLQMDVTHIDQIIRAVDYTVFHLGRLEQGSKDSNAQDGRDRNAARLHLRVRWQILWFPRGPQSGSHHAHVSASLPAIPSSGISPTRF